MSLVGKLHKTPVKKPGLVLMTLKATPYLTLAEVAETVGKSLSAVERAAANLVRTGKLIYRAEERRALGSARQMIQGTAKKAGITQATLSQMEKADNELRTATLEKLADAMGLDVEQLQD